MHQSRRHFLQTTLGASALLTFAPRIPGFLARAGEAARRRPGPDETILVVLQLSGGNDGLNSVVPFTNDAYIKARPTLHLREDEVLKLNDELGFHPRLQAFKALHDEGLLGILQGVGCDKLSRDHDGAMRTWHVADPGETPRQTGWIGRAADALIARPGTATPACFMGGIPRPFALNAAAAVVPAFRGPQDLLLRDGRAKSVRGSAHAEAPVNPLLNQVRQAAAEAEAQSSRLRAILEQGEGGNGYPDFPFAQDLRGISQLIQADLGTRIFFAELGGGGIGGFDNHANQAGNHDALLEQLATGVAAFVRDLRRHDLLDRVVLMTFSEFGRTLEENGRHGTNHGAAGPVFLAGGGVAAGLLGSHPSLTDLDQGGLRHSVDFRQLYSAVLGNWLGLDAADLLGGTFEPASLWPAA
ncbi:MAG: DUF1501 domain-containing protein [Verrucomicrobiales bacterium]|nr:DUF1501 domain-containing protein [Verrucomicrobiales bacterium]